MQIQRNTLHSALYNYTSVQYTNVHVCIHN